MAPVERVAALAEVARPGPALASCVRQRSVSLVLAALAVVLAALAKVLACLVLVPV
ncbi:hypothetical protein D3C74_507220 [compost metagenome]